MAEAVVTFMLERLGGFLIDSILHEAEFLYGVNDQVNREKAEPRRMRCFLKDADAFVRGGDERYCESSLSVSSLEDFAKVFRAFVVLLRGPMEQLLREARPDCIVSDRFFTWSGPLADELGVPRLAFHLFSYIGHCGELSAMRGLYDVVVRDGEEVLSLRGLPHKMEMLRSQLPNWITTPSAIAEFRNEIFDYAKTSDGVIVNSFTELESGYEEWFMRTHGIKAWSVGPTLLRVEDNGYNSAVSSDENHEVLNWLSSKEHGSVVYVSFGTTGKLHKNQLFELAQGLEACGHPFVWLVSKVDSSSDSEAFPEGFEERMKKNGTALLAKGWVPQKQILRHPAVGGFVTHCGWNSVLECISVGLPIITWPMIADHFFIEKLLVDVLGVAVAIGSTEWKSTSYAERKELVKREQIANAVAAVMGGGEGTAEIRKRSRKLPDAAKKAVESGGSSHANFMELINELKLKKIQKRTSTTTN